jgi:hypothetical protein
MTKQLEEFRDVPTQVFRNFLEALTAASISDEIIERFRRALFEDEDFSERALREAIFGEERLE